MVSLWDAARLTVPGGGLVATAGCARCLVCAEVKPPSMLPLRGSVSLRPCERPVTACPCDDCAVLGRGSNEITWSVVHLGDDQGRGVRLPRFPSGTCC